MVTPSSCRPATLCSPRRNHNSSPTTERTCTRLVVTSGKPSDRWYLNWCPNTLRTPVPVRSPLGVPCSSTCRRKSSYCVSTATSGTIAPGIRAAQRPWEDARVETGNVLTPSAADAAVRPGRAGDGPALGAIQARAWSAAFGAVVGRLDPGDLAAAWEAAVSSPPSRRHAVLVATAGGVVVGFVAVAPATDADLGADVGEILVLAVDPPHQRGGHGARPLAAATPAPRREGVPRVGGLVPPPPAAPG